MNDKCIHFSACKNLAGILNVNLDLYCEDCPECKDKSHLVELPCRVGDTLWYPKNGEISHSTVEFVSYDELYDTIYTRIDGYRVSVLFEDVGKLVFLTKEEAEKALKEKETNG